MKWGKMFLYRPMRQHRQSLVVSVSQEHVRAFSSVGLEHLVDIEKVVGSNPVMPI